ncbi:MAG: UvrD-helicase domain-containing protein, partial [Alistipes sp.]|nr:UvrD-helicase domain-containing protein [Alistipes sp.]
MRAKILSASAGSGKTYRLAYKFVHDTIKHYPEKPYLYRAILAVTFTNKATEEMKSRILENINELIECPAQSDYMRDLKQDLALSEAEIIKRARAIQSRILHDYSRFTILTIDKFFQRIMRAFIKELGIDINYNIELETSNILSRSTDALIEDIRSDSELQQWITDFTRESIDENDRWDIRQNMQSLGSELFKERSREALARQFSREQMRELVSKLDSQLKDIYTQLKSEGERAMQIITDAGLTTSDFTGKSRSFANYFQLIADGAFKAPTDAIRNRAEDESGWSKDRAAQALAPTLRQILSNICQIYDKTVNFANTVQLIKSRYRSYALLQDIYRKVCEQCDAEGVMLLSETQYILSRFIADNDAPFIYEKVGNRFERFMIDEFQDTSAKEWSNFVPLLKNAMAQEEDTSVLIVGDVKQSIYRWRGGDWRILAHNVANDLGKKDTEFQIMDDNWRSLRQIVEFNNMAIKAIVETDNTALNATLQQAVETSKLSKECYYELLNTVQDAYVGLKQTPRKKSARDGYVRIDYYQEEPAIIECIESAIARGYKYSDIMILHRSATDGAAAAEILLEYKLRTGKQFNIMTQDTLVIKNSPICKFIISVMRLSQDGNDTISRAIVNNHLDRAIDTPLSEQELTMIDSISQLTPEQAFEQIVEFYALNQDVSEIAYLQALHEQVTTFCASKVADIQLFLTAWDEKLSQKSLTVEKSDNTIELLTIHKAKGLEKPVIIIPYCSWLLRPAYDIVWAEHNKIGR